MENARRSLHWDLPSGTAEGREAVSAFENPDKADYIGFCGEMQEWSQASGARRQNEFHSTYALS